jgi:hypothetical protein
LLRIRTIGLREQAAWMKQHLANFDCRVHGGRMECHGAVRPTPLSREYSVVISYESGRRPRVFLPGQQLLRRAADKRIPHTYADDEPCLYYPPALEWRSDMKISASVVGWLAHWLHYYEIWYATGEWLGGGIDHGINEGTI